jgi:hypothetical protein
MLENNEENNLGNIVDQMYKDKYPSEFENQILEILNQIPFNDKSHNNNVLYKKVYKFITLILTQTKLRPLRDEVSTAVIAHLRVLQCIDKKHLQEMLNLFNLIDFNAKPTPYFDMDNFLMSILFKENLAVKLRTEIKDDEYEIIHTFLSTTSNSIIVRQLAASHRRLTSMVLLNSLRKLSLKWRIQNPWKAVGKFASTPSTIPCCLSDKIVSLGMFSVLISSRLRSSERYHIQLSSLSSSTTPNARGKRAPSPSNPVARSNVPRYLLFRYVLSSPKSGRHAFKKPYIDA